MPFLSDLVPVVIHPNGVYELTQTVCYQGNTERIEIPVGFDTDMASVPRFMTWLTPVAGVHNRAAILHDWLCVQQAEAKRTGTTAVISSIDTDGMFRRCLRELGVRAYLARAYWVGVRWGALANSARRADWWRTAPAVLGWTLLLLPILPAGLLTGLTLAIGRVVRGISDTARFLVSRHVLPPAPVLRTESARERFADRRKA